MTGAGLASRGDHHAVRERGGTGVAQLLTSAPRETLRIACPPGLVHAALTGVLLQFSSRCPNIRVAVTVSNRRVDLVEEPFDLAIRAREWLDTDASLIVRKFGISRRIFIAAPAYLAARSAIQQPEDLGREQLLTLAEDGATTSGRGFDRMASNGRWNSRHTLHRVGFRSD